MAVDRPGNASWYLPCKMGKIRLHLSGSSPRESSVHPEPVLKMQENCTQEAILESCPTGQYKDGVLSHRAFCSPFVTKCRFLFATYGSRLIESLTLLESSSLFGICQQNKGCDIISSLS